MWFPVLFTLADIVMISFTTAWHIEAMEIGVPRQIRITALVTIALMDIVQVSAESADMSLCFGIFV